MHTFWGEERPPHTGPNGHGTESNQAAELDTRTEPGGLMLQQFLQDALEGTMELQEQTGTHHDNINYIAQSTGQGQRLS